MVNLRYLQLLILFGNHYQSNNNYLSGGSRAAGQDAPQQHCQRRQLHRQVKGWRLGHYYYYNLKAVTTLEPTLKLTPTLNSSEILFSRKILTVVDKLSCKIKFIL